MPRKSRKKIKLPQEHSWTLTDAEDKRIRAFLKKDKMLGRWGSRGMKVKVTPIE